MVLLYLQPLQTSQRDSDPMGVVWTRQHAVVTLFPRLKAHFKGCQTLLYLWLCLCLLAFGLRSRGISAWGMFLAYIYCTFTWWQNLLQHLPNTAVRITEHVRGKLRPLLGLRLAGWKAARCRSRSSRRVWREEPSWVSAVRQTQPRTEAMRQNPSDKHLRHHLHRGGAPRHVGQVQLTPLLAALRVSLRAALCDAVFTSSHSQFGTQSAGALNLSLCTFRGPTVHLVDDFICCIWKTTKSGFTMDARSKASAKCFHPVYLQFIIGYIQTWNHFKLILKRTSSLWTGWRTRGLHSYSTKGRNKGWTRGGQGAVQGGNEGWTREE